VISQPLDERPLGADEPKYRELDAQAPGELVDDDVQRLVERDDRQLGVANDLVHSPSAGWASWRRHGRDAFSDALDL
jgi:hypothetical protein